MRVRRSFGRLLAFRERGLLRQSAKSLHFGMRRLSFLAKPAAERCHTRATAGLAGVASGIGAAGVDARAAGDLLARGEQAGIRLGLWEATSDLEVPVFVCRAFDDAAVGAGTDPECGTGCHPDREVALLRSLAEA